MSLKDYILRDGEKIVGKYRTSSEPNVPEEYDVEVVDDVDDYDVDEWWNERF